MLLVVESIAGPLGRLREQSFVLALTNARLAHAADLGEPGRADDEHFEYGRHEIAAMFGAEIWFENVVVPIALRHLVEVGIIVEVGVLTEVGIIVHPESWIELGLVGRDAAD